MIAAVREAKTQPDDAPYRARVPVAAQVELGRRMLGMIGFDFDAGRLDTSARTPSARAWAPATRRLTTRYDETASPTRSSAPCTRPATPSTTGPPQADHFGKPLRGGGGAGDPRKPVAACGRTSSAARAAFWDSPAGGAAASPSAPAERSARTTGTAPSTTSAQPHPHRSGRGDLQPAHHAALRAGAGAARRRLAVADLPAAWNEKIGRTSGSTPPDDARGCLQDIHWSGGAFGYFPTYTLGNLYAAQFWEAIARDIPEIEPQIAQGEFSALLGWLREKIHRTGGATQPRSGAARPPARALGPSRCCAT